MSSQDNQSRSVDINQESVFHGLQSQQQFALPLEFPLGDRRYVAVLPAETVRAVMAEQGMGSGFSPSSRIATPDSQGLGMLGIMEDTGGFDGSYVAPNTMQPDMNHASAPSTIPTTDSVFDSIFGLPSPSGLPSFEDHDYHPRSSNDPSPLVPAVGAEKPGPHPSPSAQAVAEATVQEQLRSNETAQGTVVTQRQRNSVASARFRQRRRERERGLSASLEASRVEVRDLRTRVQELRAENNLLREIMTSDRLRREDSSATEPQCPGA